MTSPRGTGRERRHDHPRQHALPHRRDAALAAREEPGLCAVRLDGMNLVMDRAGAEGLEADGVAFCYLCWCAWAGRVMSVPVN